MNTQLSEYQEHLAVIVRVEWIYGLKEDDVKRYSVLFVMSKNAAEWSQSDLHLYVRDKRRKTCVYRGDLIKIKN